MPNALIRRTRLKRRLATAILFFVALVLGMGWYTASRMREASKSLESIYRDRIVCIQQLRVVGDAYRSRIPDAVEQMREGLLDASTAIRRVQAAQRDASRQWEDYKQTYLSPHEAELVAATEPVLKKANLSADDLKRLLALQAEPSVSGLAPVAVREAFGAVSRRVEQLLALQVEISQEEVERGDALYAHTFWATCGFVALAALGGGLFAWIFWRRFNEDERAHDHKVNRLNSYYAALSETNQLIVRERDAAALLNEICRICVEHGRSKVACVFLSDGDTANKFAIAGASEELRALVPVTVDLTRKTLRQSMLVKALLYDTHSISQDYRREAPSSEWQEIAARAGVHAAAAFPLRRAGKVVGALALYAPEVGFFDDALVQLLDEMVVDVSFALDNIDREADRAREQKETIESLENFKAVFQASPVSGAIADLDNGVVFEANDAFCERYGVSREEMIGHTMRELGIGMVSEDAQRYRETTRREGRVRNLEVRTTLPGGGVATVLANTQVIQYEGRACILSMTMDVTELRRAAAAREAQIEAEAANRAKTDFLSRMSHELRTPLNAMLGFTQLMRRDARERLTPGDLLQLEHIHQAGWHLLSLVNDVLDVSRIESGSFEVQPRALALTPVLDEALQMSKALAAQSGISLRAGYRSFESIGVQADPVRLRQIFINLLSNAIKYNRPGGSVHVEVGAIDGKALIEVVDTGLGMTHEQLTHLYEPFNRLGRERGGIEGTGLGLALTRQLVRQMGGDLQVESQAGHGTRAKVMLQLSALPTDSNPGITLVPTARASADPSGVVLYIEDNEINVMVVEQMLARWSGVQFVHAPDGRTGLEQATKLKPDLVLLDMQLPDVDGFEVLRELRQGEPTRNLYVAVLSASAMEDDVQQALAGGAMEYWTKPLDLEQFLANVAHILSRNATVQ